MAGSDWQAVDGLGEGGFLGLISNVQLVLGHKAYGDISLGEVLLDDLVKCREKGSKAMYVNVNTERGGIQLIWSRFR